MLMESTLAMQKVIWEVAMCGERLSHISLRKKKRKNQR